MGELRALLLVLAVLAAPATRAQEDGPAFLVANINRAVDPSAGSWAYDFTAAGQFFYFVADDGTHGPALWRSDRTPAGTALVADLVAPGPYYQHAGPRELTALSDTLYFTHHAAAGGLWRVRGAGAPEAVEHGPVWAVQRLGAQLIFARDGQLWITDGTPGAARWVAPLPDEHDARFASETRLFALECHWERGCALWSSDGTAAGTGLVRQLGPGPLQFFSSLDLDLEHAVLDDVVYFLAETPAAGVELWRSDGSADGTWLVRDLNPGPASAFVRHYDHYGDHRASLTRVGDALLFVASDGTTGFELWRSDGTASGTELVADLVPGAHGLFDCVATQQECDAYAEPALLGDILYLTVREPGEDGRWHLWRSDGTARGTRRIESGVGPHLAASGDNVYFVIRGANNVGAQLWRRRGFDTASTLVRELPGWPSTLTALPGGLAFNVAPDELGWWSGEPWWSDGTAAGTALLRDIRGDDASAAPRDLIALGEAVLFGADDGVHGRELWRSNGAADGTTLVADIAPGPAGADPRRPVRVGDAVFFVADDGQHGAELWRSDGSPAGTWMVADVRPGAEGSAPTQLTAAGELIYFFADDGVHGRELWRSDGGDDTFLIADLQAGSGDGEVNDWAPPVALGQALVFLADHSTHGVSLWRSDGHPFDARLLTDFGGRAGRWTDTLAAGNGYAWTAILGDGAALWRSDGTPAGTTLVAHFDDISGIVASGGGVFAMVRRGDSRAVWRIDDLRGPQPVGDADEVSGYLVDAGGVLMGFGDGSLWRPGAGRVDAYGRFAHLVAFDRRVLLLEGLHFYDALRLWASDGTGEGSFPLQTLPPIKSGRRQYGEFPSSADFATAGGLVFFPANAGEVGEELWALPLEALPELCVEDCPHLPTPVPTATPAPTPTQTCSLDCTALHIGEVTAAAGERVSLSVTLEARGEAVAGVLLDLVFPPQARIAATARGGADCRVDPSIGKDASVFVFQPSGCDPVRTCTAVRALILSLLDVDPIADGATLFTCQVAVARRARPGTYPMRVGRAELTSPAGWPLSFGPFGVREGAVTVARSATLGSTGTSAGCQVASGADAGGLWLLLLAILPALATRRR